MSKLTRVLMVGAMMAAMNLAGMAAIAQTTEAGAVEQFRGGERASQEQTTEAGAVEQFRRGERASEERSDNFPQTPAQVPGRTERAARLARRLPWRAGCGHGARRWAGHVGGQAG